MQEINIGDIIAPNTPHRRKRYGKGLVLDNSRYITAIFPQENNNFMLYEFRKDKVEVVEASPEESLSIDRADLHYRQFQATIKNV